MYNKFNDGKTHINVYSKGRTELGRFLSNFALAPIETEDGRFNTMEGYYYWLSSHDDLLRTMSGHDAKQHGRLIGASEWLDSEYFRLKICNAIRIKMETNPEMLKEFTESELPFTHYYTYGTKVVNVEKVTWITEFLEQYRELLKG